MGDADIIHTDTEKSHANIEAGVRAALAANALPVVIGGDHSVNIPCVRAYADQPPIHILQIDAHLDFVDTRHGVRHGHGNAMRRAAEQDHVTGLTQVGIRNVSSTARDGYDDARRMGSDILSVRQTRALGPAAVAERIPVGARVYVTLDIDAFCPSIAPGTGTPSHGGFCTTKCWNCCKQSPAPTTSPASTWSRSPRITTPPAAQQFWRRRYC